MADCGGNEGKERVAVQALEFQINCESLNLRLAGGVLWREGS
jgi:hypothetical protein